jgi:endonuclease-3
VPIRKKPGPPIPSGPPADVAEVSTRLATAIPQPRCELDHKDPWTLLVATILSAQSTDRTVNAVTPLLFQKWPTPEALAAAPREEVEVVVHRTGFFRNKAKAIQGASLAIHQLHKGVVPREMSALVQLPGVARKTANVVLGSAYGMNEGFVVDTHVMRLSQRLRLTRNSEPPKIEPDLMDKLPRDKWTKLGHQLIWHGRRVCFARKPNCGECALAPHCPSAFKV